MYKHGLGTQVTERLSMSHMNDVIGMVAYLENISSVVPIGDDIMIKDHVMTKNKL